MIADAAGVLWLHLASRQAKALPIARTLRTLTRDAGLAGVDRDDTNRALRRPIWGIGAQSVISPLSIGFIWAYHRCSGLGELRRSRKVGHHRRPP